MRRDRSLLGLGSLGDFRVPARLDLDDELPVAVVVDRLEIGALLLFGQLILYGLFTELALSVQVSLAMVVVIVADLVDRKLIG